MKLLTLILKELIEMIKILQFRCWNEFAQINVSSMTIFNIAVICFKGSEEDGTISMLRLGRSKKFQSCAQIL